MRTATRNTTTPANRRISRRRFLAGTLLTSAATGLAIAGVPSAQAQKASKAAANYQTQPNRRQRCSGCRYFEQPNACRRVQGAISPDGWCAFWSSGGGGRGYTY